MCLRRRVSVHVYVSASTRLCVGVLVLMCRRVCARASARPRVSARPRSTDESVRASARSRAETRLAGTCRPDRFGWIRRAGAAGFAATFAAVAAAAAAGAALAAAEEGEPAAAFSGDAAAAAGSSGVTAAVPNAADGGGGEAGGSWLRSVGSRCALGGGNAAGAADAGAAAREEWRRWTRSRAPLQLAPCVFSTASVACSKDSNRTKAYPRFREYSTPSALRITSNGMERCFTDGHPRRAKNCTSSRSLMSVGRFPT